MQTLLQTQHKITALDAALIIEALSRSIIRLELLERMLEQVGPLADSSLDRERRSAFALTLNSVQEMRERFKRERDELMSGLEIQAVIEDTGCAERKAEAR